MTQPATSSRLTRLPRIMLAPTGARRTKADHPELPLSVAEITATAIACQRAGAGAIHAHIRDPDGRHSLDTGLYAELLAALHSACPDLPVQLTTESVGLYSPAQQRACLAALRPDGFSIALTEMLADGDIPAARRSYFAAQEAGIAIQHILYTPEDVALLAHHLALGTFPAPEQAGLQLMLVLGRYTPGQQSTPAMLTPYLSALQTLPPNAGQPDWAICAFGPGETACLYHALQSGGKVRVGFENSLWHSDGSLARDNADRVAVIAALE